MVAMTCNLNNIVLHEASIHRGNLGRLPTSALEEHLRCTGGNAHTRLVLPMQIHKFAGNCRAA